MYGTGTYAEFAIIFSVVPAEPEEVIGCIKHQGGGEPRINIQNEHGCAKVYQVKQVAAALEKLILENKNG